MKLSEALATGGMVTVTGIVIVFAVLIILMLVMMAMKKVFYKVPAKNQTHVEVKQTVQPKDIPTAAPAEDLTLIAVLTAAVASSMDAPASKIRIKSFRRVGGSAPAWNRAGLRDVIDSRF